MSDVDRIRACVQHVSESLRARPPASKPDVPARAVWQGGLAVQLECDKPQALRTDMPQALGGGDAAPSPGWFFRAGAASCLASTIAMHAAARGITLRRLEVEAHSESDPRGMLGCVEGVPPGPQSMRLDVVIEADDADAAALQELVAYADAHAPMSGALRRPLQVTTGIRVAQAATA